MTVFSHIIWQKMGGNIWLNDYFFPGSPTAYVIRHLVLRRQKKGSEIFLTVFKSQARTSVAPNKSPRIERGELKFENGALSPRNPFFPSFVSGKLPFPPPRPFWGARLKK